MKVFASIQEESTGRVFIIMSNGFEYFWLRGTPGCKMYGPFEQIDDVLVSLAEVEGKSPQHWTDVFTFFYPDLPIVGPLGSTLRV